MCGRWSWRTFLEHPRHRHHGIAAGGSRSGASSVRPRRSDLRALLPATLPGDPGRAGDDRLPRWHGHGLRADPLRRVPARRSRAAAHPPHNPQNPEPFGDARPVPLRPNGRLARRPMGPGNRPPRADRRPRHHGRSLPRARVAARQPGCGTWESGESAGAMLTYGDIAGVTSDPFVQTGVLAAVGAVVTRILLRDLPTCRLLGQLLFFLGLTALLLYHG